MEENYIQRMIRKGRELAKIYEIDGIISGNALTISKWHIEEYLEEIHKQDVKTIYLVGGQADLLDVLYAIQEHGGKDFQAVELTSSLEDYYPMKALRITMG